MANVPISATAVKIVGAGAASQVQYGETITHGQVVYLDAATNRYKLALGSGSSAQANVFGVAITPGANGDYGYVARGGTIVQLNTSAVMSIGRVYVLSGTAGAIAPEADLAGQSFSTILGVAVASTQLKLDIFAAGVGTSS